jgi:hypothetical protein
MPPKNPNLVNYSTSRTCHVWDTHNLVAIIGCASTCSYRVMVDADCLVFSKRSTAGYIPKSRYTTFKFHAADGVQYSVKIGYEYNGSSSDCIENQLLRSVGEYNDNEAQNRYLRDYLCRLLYLHLAFLHHNNLYVRKLLPKGAADSRKAIRKMRK